VVTPNRRLAASVLREFDESQAARGIPAWQAADILPVSAFIERLYEDALYSGLAGQLPQLLSPVQAQVLWERVISESDEAQALSSVPRTAGLARKAWTLAHEWSIAARLEHFPAGEDGRAFARWALDYERLTARMGYTDHARLSQLLSTLLCEPALRKPSRLFVYGFEIKTPAQEAFFGALQRAGVEVCTCSPDQRAAQARRVSFTSVKEEIRAAARWARSRLESRPDARIGIVVPDLERSRKAVHRIFREVMNPSWALSSPVDPVLPFNISLGEPLITCPPVAAALLILDMASGEVPYSAASRLLRSPFIAGAQSELAARATLDAALRNIAGARIGLNAMQRMIARLVEREAPHRAPSCPALSRVLAQLAEFSARNLSGLGTVADSARRTDELLKAAGYPGDRTLDSLEFQTLVKWHELLSEFATLEGVSSRMHFGEARSHLARMAADSLFQPEAPETPVQILGVLESAGLRFDHLWVMGLTDEAWPLGAKPNPFIAVPLQRAAGVPEASAALSLELDRRITEGWLGSAEEVILSHAMREEDRELSSSPLIVHLPKISFEELALADHDTPARVLRLGRRIDFVADPAPALAQRNSNTPIRVPGGTSVFRDQAVCPFRAFALHRLGAEWLEEAAPGLDARDRGTLLHSMLAKVWSRLKTKAKLDSTSERDLDGLLAEAADTAVNHLRGSRPGAMSARFAELEKERLKRIGRDWLNLEKKRPGFEVVAIEEKHAVAFGGVAVNAKLDRMDRIVTDGNGERNVILDYKTGRISVAGWLGQRPDEPQLPLYAVAGGAGAHEVAGIAFARVKPGEMRFSGIAGREGLIPGVGTVAEQRPIPGWPFRSWEELRALWRAEFEALGREFASGEARVAPKQGEKSCRHCELKALCRIAERVPVPFEEEPPPSET